MVVGNNYTVIMVRYAISILFVTFSYIQIVLPDLAEI